MRTATPGLHKTNECPCRNMRGKVHVYSLEQGNSESSAKDWRRVNLSKSDVSQGMHLARVAKLADARDLKSRVPNRTYRFDSGPGHHKIQQLNGHSLPPVFARQIVWWQLRQHLPDTVFQRLGRRGPEPSAPIAWPAGLSSAPQVPSQCVSQQPPSLIYL